MDNKSTENSSSSTAAEATAVPVKLLHSVEDVDVEDVSCLQIMGLATKCSNPLNHLRNVRMHGEINTKCTEYLNDWALCMRAKAILDPNEKSAILRSTFLAKELVRKSTGNDVWQYKKYPSWGFDDEE